MKIEIHDSLDETTLCFTFSKSFQRNEIESAARGFDSYIKSIDSLIYSLLENNSFSMQTDNSINDILDYIERYLIDNSDVDTVYTIKLNCKKFQSGSLIFYSYQHYKSIFTGDPRKDIKIFSSLTARFDSIILHSESLNISLKLSSVNKYSSDNIFHRYNFEEKIGVNPAIIYQVGSDLSVCEVDNYTLSLFVYMSMVIFSNKCKKEGGFYHFIFEGLSNVSISVGFDENIKNIHRDVYEIFSWIYCDSSSVAKVSILRNVISSNHIIDIYSAFSKEIIFVIESNYQLYHQDNIKQYIELKNKVIDFIFSISNKLSDSYDSYFNSNKVSLVAILSYLVTLVVIRGVAQDKVESHGVFICLLSLAFFIVCLVHTAVVNSELQSKVDYYLKQKDELKGRYSNMLSKLELDQLFDSNSFESAISKSSKAIFHIIVYTILSILIVIDLSLILFLIYSPF